MLTFAGILFAQSPFAGAWKPDTAKTHWSGRQTPKDVTLTIDEQAEDLQITKGANADGSPTSLSYTVPVKGGEGQNRRRTVRWH